MKSYPNPLLSRDVMIAEARAHREADRLVPGIYWNGASGCSVGCSVETVNRRTKTNMSHADHLNLARALGIPENLVWLQDSIFEGLPGHPDDAQQAWPERFYTALPEGADLSGVWLAFAVWMLREIVWPVAGVNQEVVERVARGVETEWSDDDDVDASMAAVEAAKTSEDLSDRILAWECRDEAGMAALLDDALAAAYYASSLACCAAEAAVGIAEGECASEVVLDFTETFFHNHGIPNADAGRIDAWQRMADKLCELMTACGDTR